jgi:hypothetical protein
VLITKQSDQIKKNEIGEACGTCGRQRRCVQGSGGETEGKSALGRPRLRWEDNIKMDFEEVGWVGMD